MTYQGQTLEELTALLDYVNFALTHDLERWERKEFEESKKEYEFKIKDINERINQL